VVVEVAVMLVVGYEDDGIQIGVGLAPVSGGKTIGANKGSVAAELPGFRESR
jgi:hypothetical protein